VAKLLKKKDKRQKNDINFVFLQLNKPKRVVDGLCNSRIASDFLEKKPERRFSCHNVIFLLSITHPHRQNRP